ncbi:MAG: BspA family leucine-rich repeat surface protein [Helicobacter sp.]|nr:BspA family leucine-rich repeat surface protein [Helicobacter sp.]MDY5616734.1 BspA family leucine-rich repeat surface protein [Helicobacter sp.]
MYLSDIDTSAITDMRALFKDVKRKNFSGIEYWDTSNVITMEGMFAGCKHFNIPI